MTERGASITRRLLAFARHADLDAQTIAVGDLLGGLRELVEPALGVDVRIVAPRRAARASPRAAESRPLINNGTAGGVAEWGRMPTLGFVSTHGTPYPLPPPPLLRLDRPRGRP